MQEDGSILWNQPFHSATYGQILRTAEAKVLPGDPQRIYLVSQSQQGNGLMFGWAFFLTVLNVLNFVLSKASDVEGAIGPGAGPRVRKLSDRRHAYSDRGSSHVRDATLCGPPSVRELA